MGILRRSRMRYNPTIIFICIILSLSYVLRASVRASAAKTPCLTVFIFDLRNLDRTHSAYETLRHLRFTRNLAYDNFYDLRLPFQSSSLSSYLYPHLLIP
jgi:hypothetical protein